MEIINSSDIGQDKELKGTPNSPRTDRSRVNLPDLNVNPNSPRTSLNINLNSPIADYDVDEEEGLQTSEATLNFNIGTIYPFISYLY